LEWASLEVAINESAVKPNTKLPRHFEARERRRVIAFMVMYRGVTCNAQLVKEVQHIARIVSINTETPQQISLRFNCVGK
jgi:hypothetical protein